MRDLEGKVAVITGAGRLRGIGRAAAVALAARGADVVVTGTGRDPATFPEDEKAQGWRDVDSVVELIEAQGQRGLAVRFDVTDETQVAAAFAQIHNTMGSIDILINNAALGRGDDRIPIGALEASVFQRVIDIKLRGAFLCTRAASQYMLEAGNGGKIVNIASIAGKRGSANTLAYNAANFGMIGMTQSMARELGANGINVNCVCPGAVKTSRMDAVSPDDRPEQIAPSDPIPRWGSDDEVGEFVAYLCTPAARWIHGQSINQDGGMVMEH
ncbi:MAG: SDR family oxidoreductase [Pseudomonadota bacterium]